MSNRFPVPSIRHTRNVKYTVDCHARVIDGFWCRPMSVQRRKSRRTYFSRDRFIQFNLATRHPWQPRCSRHTSYCPPFHRHLILFYPSRISLSLSLSFSLSLSVPSVLLPLQVEMVARICWPSVPFNFSSHRNWGDVRRESRSTSVAVVKDLVRGETVLCRLLLVFFRDYYYR